MDTTCTQPCSCISCGDTAKEKTLIVPTSFGTQPLHQPNWTPVYRDMEQDRQGYDLELPEDQGLPVCKSSIDNLRQGPSASEPLYFKDYQVNLSQAIHQTPGLVGLANRSLYELIYYGAFLQRGWEGLAYIGEEICCYPRQEPVCTPQFTPARLKLYPNNWYHNNRVIKKKGKEFAKIPKNTKIIKECQAFTANIMLNTKTRPVFWDIIGNKWTADAAQVKITEAVEWFSKYCITVDARQIKMLKPQKQVKKFQQSLPDFDKTLKRFEKIRKKSVAPNAKQAAFAILFIDAIPAPGVQYRGNSKDTDRGGRFTIAGNFGEIPLILIPHATDADSKNIVTHELIHALGKKFASTSKTINPETYKTGKNSENYEANAGHGKCSGNDMGNSSRTRLRPVFNNADNRLLDYASYAYFVWNGNIG